MIDSSLLPGEASLDHTCTVYDTWIRAALVLGRQPQTFAGHVQQTARTPGQPGVHVSLYTPSVYPRVDPAAKSLDGSAHHDSFSCVITTAGLNRPRRGLAFLGCRCNCRVDPHDLNLHDFGRNFAHPALGPGCSLESLRATLKHQPQHYSRLDIVIRIAHLVDPSAARLHWDNIQPPIDP